MGIWSYMAAAHGLTHEGTHAPGHTHAYTNRVNILDHTKAYQSW